VAGLKPYFRHLPALLGIVLLIGAIIVVRHEFHRLHLGDIKRAIADIPMRALLLSGGWTVLSYCVLTLYDRLGTIYAGHRVKYRRTALASFCAYALSHNLGFNAVSGAAVRYRLYAHWGLTPLQIAKVVAFCSLTFGLGGMVLGGAILLQEPAAVPFLGDILPHGVFYGLAALLWAIVAGYVFVSSRLGTFRIFGHEVTLPDWRMAIVQVLLATVDVSVTASIFYTLLPRAEGLTYLRFLGVYVASYTAGLAASLPGGIGVFDTAILLGLAPYLQAAPVVGGILIFRLYYYIIPLFLAGTLFAGNEVLLRGRSLWRGRAQVIGRWSEPEFAVAASTGAVALCGTLLLSLGVLTPRPDFAWIDPDFGPEFVDVAASAGQYVPSLIGTALMVLAVALSRRVTLAWGTTIILLLTGAGFTAAQGQSLWIPGVLVLAVFLVAPFRGAYYRHARLLTDPLEASTVIPLFALIGCVTTLAAFRTHVRGLRVDSWWAAVLSHDLPNSWRLTIALTVLLALAAAWRLLRPARVTWLPWAGEGKLRYAAFGVMPPVNADGLVLGEGGRAGIPFRRLGRVMLGLGDPVGADTDRASAIWRLRDLARQEGLDPAFWDTGPDLVQFYADLGLTPLPLGKDGLPLPAQVDDREPEASHYLCCVAQRDLTTLLPMLPVLAAGRDLPEREPPSPRRTARLSL
jgi:glycosyltransferase 2 family protein